MPKNKPTFKSPHKRRRLPLPNYNLAPLTPISKPRKFALPVFFDDSDNDSGSEMVSVINRDRLVFLEEGYTRTHGIRIIKLDLFPNPSA